MGPQHGAGDTRVLLHRAGTEGTRPHSDDKGEEGARTTSRYPRESWWNQSVNAMSFPGSSRSCCGVRIP
ncbi:hypothetical protein SLI_6281 [Streptomyces lividans 1326]|uniref:Uncharacterized protein n=1 Tax=Streptomyces lividans 1326 TaxID=1200984 RepID=A0A7U9HEN0_STRLI|nr:hypothetical protein SLI_6281 [Streptomyces lividans 1326]